MALPDLLVQLRRSETFRGVALRRSVETNRLAGAINIWLLTEPTGFGSPADSQWFCRPVTDFKVCATSRLTITD